jgi:hypothetical protein
MTLIMAAPSTPDVREVVLSVVRAARDAATGIARAETAGHARRAWSRRCWTGWC